MELDDLDREVQETERHFIGEPTRKVYRPVQHKFLIFILGEEAILLRKDLAEHLQTLSEKEQRALLKPILDNPTPPPPFEFGDGSQMLRLTKRYIQSLDTGKSARQTAQSAIKQMFQGFGHQFSIEQEAELQLFRKSLVKRLVIDAQANGERIGEGKSPLSVQLYKILSWAFLKSLKKNGVFCHTMLVLGWNLACRIGNTEGIGLGQLAVRDDALQIYFAHTKTDKEGKQAKYPRHIYANPFEPEVCCVLALGLYFVLFPKTEGDKKLFAGSAQYNHFYKELLAILKDSHECADQLELDGISAEDIGTHSVRKGAGTYCTACNVECPSHVAVCTRCGWKLDGVQGTYLQYAAAGDQHVGRTLALLPSFDANFAILPPFFVGGEDLIDTALKDIFSGFPQSMRGVLRFCLASLVFHRKWLSDNLPHDHRLFSSRLFRDIDLLNRLGDHVQCRLWKEGDPFLPTGVTNSVKILAEVRESRALMQSIADRLDGFQ